MTTTYGKSRSAMAWTAVALLAAVCAVGADEDGNAHAVVSPPLGAGRGTDMAELGNRVFAARGALIFADDFESGDVSTWVETVPDGGGDDAKNIISAHDSSSPEYKKECRECHGDILTRTTLAPPIVAAHVAMLPFVPGKEDKQCTWCHRTVDLTQGTQRVEKSHADLRKRVDTLLCTLCHGPFGPAKQFYQAGLSPTEPDGPVLYELVCASCHRGLQDSKVGGESAREIQKKIDEDEGGMGPLSVLSPAEIQAIADALKDIGD